MYGKVFASLYQGTLRGKAHEILVFTNMIACSDRDGVVDRHPKAIADEVGLTVEQVRVAIEYLEAEDPESRSREFGGARIRLCFEGRAWGWEIVNYEKYRNTRDDADRREQVRLAVKRFREKKSSVITCNHGKPREREREMQKEKEMQKEENTTTRQAAAPPRGRQKKAPVSTNPPTLDEVQAYVEEVSGPIPAQEFLDANERSGWTYGKKGDKPVIDWKAHYRTWARSRVKAPQSGPEVSPEQEAAWLAISRGEE